MPELTTAVLAMRNQEVLSTREHMRLCGDWFLLAQAATNSGGYMASYSLITGPARAYIETTGYIVPTMLDLAATLAEPRYRDCALRAGEWLLTVQQPDGAFMDVDEHKPQVFDTGQVMLGLNRLYRETKDNRYIDATRRAADWLVRAQDSDGSWATAAYFPGNPATYQTRVAAAMLESGQLTGEPRYREAAVKYLHWAASRQQANGCFLNCELRLGADPVLHTMVYVLEGYLMAYQLTGERKWLDILLHGAEPLLKVHLDRDLVPRSQYNAQWQVTNAEKCIPGLAQWAGLCLTLHEITKHADWLQGAALSIYYLKSKQIRKKGILAGALPASVPLWGYYHPMMFPNWAVKFFADALLLYDRYGLAVWQEQEAWVSKCIELQLDGGGWTQTSEKLQPLDTVVIGEIEAAFAEQGGSRKRILDIGCGSGRYMRELHTRFPQWQLQGIDPCTDGNGADVRKGSAYAIPFESKHFDGAFSVISLQHISEIRRALSEVRRVLRAGAKFVICDRNPVSARGLLKPLHELRGRWIYPWDSPFRERWYTVRRWKALLREAGFVSFSIRVVSDPATRGVRRWIPTNRFLVITAQLPTDSEERATIERSWQPKRFTGRWWLELGNRVLEHINLRLETLTVAKAEHQRLVTVEKNDGFSKPVFPVPLCFNESDFRTVLEAMPLYRDRLNRFAHAEDNEVKFTYGNSYFHSPDAEVLYTIIRQRRPGRILEIGCGNSTRIIRQAILDGKFTSTLTCIDPFPREEISALADKFVRARIETQDAALLAESLHAGDVLFVDTSHEVRVANDIAFIFGRLIPRLRSGVIVHIHDIFLPYEYPRHWVFDLNYHTWGEQYVVQAMLAQNGYWKAIWPGHYLQRTLPDFARHFSNCGEHFAQSLWIVKEPK